MVTGPAGAPGNRRERLAGERDVSHCCQRLLQCHRLPLGPCHGERFLAEFSMYGRTRTCDKGTLFGEEGTQGFGGTPQPDSLCQPSQSREGHANPLQIRRDGKRQVLVYLAQERQAFFEQPTRCAMFPSSRAKRPRKVRVPMMPDRKPIALESARCSSAYARA